MNSIPPFDDDLGYLPPGVYETTWAEFAQRFGTNSHRQPTFGYDSFLRRDRAGNPRGVVALDPTELIK
jgi:hypothetical protein